MFIFTSNKFFLVVRATETAVVTWAEVDRWVADGWVIEGWTAAPNRAKACQALREAGSLPE